MDTNELKRIIESLLLVSDGPLRTERIAELLEVERKQAADASAQLVEEYRQRAGGIRIEEVGGGLQLRTPPEHGEWLRRLNRSKSFRFSRAALETLSIVAYRQPITRAEVEYLRGVDSGGVLKTLLEKRLVRILGKKDIPGKPLIYGTTREFLELFGLKDLKELPSLKEFSELEIESGEGEGLLPFAEEPGAG